MDYQKIIDLVYFYSSKYKQANNFQFASQEIQSLIFNMTKIEFLPLVTQIGVIPEKIEHDSKEEKLYSKITEMFLGKCFKELGFEIAIYTTRSDSADVYVKSKFHNYSFVSDAKAFRLSRTAKNQKDFKVSSMNIWKQDNDYAVLCCPYFEYPKKKSSIYKQSLNDKVSLLSWEHLALFLKYDIKETLEMDLSYIWKFPYKYYDNTVGKNLDNNYFNEQNKYILDGIKISKNSLNDFFKNSKNKTLERCNAEIEYWENIRKDIASYTKEEAIKSLIHALKIDQKIGQINKYQKDLMKWSE